MKLKSSVLAEPVLVGRERELAELMRNLDLAFEGNGTTIFISGEAGSGKTRLINEFLKYARKKAVTILSGWCLSNAAVPYFPFFEAFNTYFSEEQDTKGERTTEATEWLKGPSQAEKFGKTQTFSPQAWKDQTFIAVAKTLTSISAKNPIVLFIDDAHWADSASLALIHYIARAISSEKVLLLATFRSEQLTADAEGRPHPLVETLRLMKREDLFREIKLNNLGEASVSELAKSMLRGDVQQELTEKLMKESQGNALFVVESLRMLHDRSGLVQEHEKWRLAGGDLKIPEKIKDIILQRLSALLHNQRKMLEAASVIGEKFDTELLASILGQDYLEVADALDMIARTTSLICSEGEQYRFDHARSRDAIYDEISPTLKKAYHGKVAEKLESASKDGKLPFSELAFHYAQAGNKEKAVKNAIAAGQDTLARWSNAQAIQHFTYAFENLPEGQSEQRATALEGLGDAYASNNMYGEAMKTFDKLAALETGRLRLRAIRKATDAAYFIWGASNLLLEYARKAEELGVDDQLEMTRILVNRGRGFGYAPSGSMEMDLADSEAALHVFEEEYSLPDVATALWRCGILRVVLESRPEKGLGELLRSVSIFGELGDARKEVEANYWAGSGFFNCFLHSEARNEYGKVLRIGEKLGMFADLSRTCNDLAKLDEWEGKFAEALSNNLKSIEYSKKTDKTSGVGSSHGGIIRIYGKMGDLTHLDEYYEKVRPGMTQEVVSHYMFAPEVAWTRGVRLAVKGQWYESNQTFEKLLESLEKSGGYSPPSLKARARIDYAWALEKQGRFEEAKVQRDRVQKFRRESEAKFEHANLQANIMVRRQVTVGEEFEMRLDLVNVSREPCSLAKADGLLTPEFEVTFKQEEFSIKNCSVDLKSRSISPFQVETIKIKVKASKTGNFTLEPQLFWRDELGEKKTCKPKPLTMTVQPAKPKYEILPGRISTGSENLDALLFGGIPEKFAVALTSPSTDERELLISRFLEAGVAVGETTFYVTAEPGNARTLAEKYPLSFYLFVCNTQADAIVQDQPNVFKLKGIENLTELDIALTKAFRKLNLTEKNAKRICLEVVSDVLLQHHAISTRRWLSALLPTLKSKGFTVLAVVDPSMHSVEELQAVLGVFDGEIRVSEKETPEGIKQTLRVRKLVNQKYKENEVLLSKEKIEE